MTNPINAFRQLVQHELLPFQQHVADVVDHVAHVVEDVAGAGAQVVHAVAAGASDVAHHVQQAGVLNVAGDAARFNATQVASILGELTQRSPADFVDWLIGPTGPSFADATRTIPGLQGAIGDVIDASMGNPLIAGAVGQALGFEYVADGDFYTTNEDSMQSNLGFHELYDKVGDLMGMDLEDKVVEFKYGDTEYKLEFWQGSYGAGGAFGGEVGLYTRGSDEQRALGPLLEKIPGYYSAAIGGDQIEITQTIYDTKSEVPYFTNAHAGADDGDHYWNLAIRTDPGVNHEDIGQRGELRMEDPKLAEAMCDAMVRAGMDATLGEDGKSITFDSH